jgi:DNA-binding response OmpR family regulator
VTGRDSGVGQAVVLGAGSATRAVCSLLEILGYVPTRSRGSSDVAVDLMVICCAARPDFIQDVEQLRARGSVAPILVVGHRSPCSHCDATLRAGADGWVPEMPRSLLRNQLTRSAPALARRAGGTWPVPSSGVSLAPDVFSVYFGTERVSLRPKEYALLAYLVGRTGDWVSETELRVDALGLRQRHETSVVRVHLRALRKALGAFASRVEGRRGYGYRFATTPSLASDRRCVVTVIGTTPFSRD